MPKLRENASIHTLRAEADALNVSAEFLAAAVSTEDLDEAWEYLEEVEARLAAIKNLYDSAETL